MISDKIRKALIQYLQDELSIDIPVVDGEAFDEIALPCVVVKIQSSEKLNPALYMVDRIEISVSTRSHLGDGTRDAVEELTDEIQDLLNNPNTLKTAINAVIADGVCVDFIQFTGGVPDWDEQTLICEFQGECYAQKGTIV